MPRATSTTWRVAFMRMRIASSVWASSSQNSKPSIGSMNASEMMSAFDANLRLRNKRTPGAQMPW